MKKEQKIQRNYHAIPVQKIKFKIMIRQKLVYSEAKVYSV